MLLLQVALSCTMCTVILHMQKRVNQVYLISTARNPAHSSHTVQENATVNSQNKVNILMKLYCYVSLLIYTLSVSIEQVTLLGGVSSVDSIEKNFILASHLQPQSLRPLMFNGPIFAFNRIHLDQTSCQEIPLQIEED